MHGMWQRNVRQILDLMDRREKERQRWLRHLHLLAAGALTLLAGMDTGSGSAGLALVFLRATWGALGLSILLGGVALYAGTTRYKILAEKMSEEVVASLRRGAGGALDEFDVRAPEPLWLRGARAGFVTSLTVATIGLVAFALIRG